MKLVEMKVNEFVDLMASDEPAPGGGSAAALVALAVCIVMERRKSGKKAA